MDALTAERSSLRGSVTKTYNNFDKALQHETQDAQAIRKEFTLLEDQCQRLLLLDEKLSELRLSQVTSQTSTPPTKPAFDYDKERERIEHYRGIWCEARVRFEDYMEQSKRAQRDEQLERESLHSDGASSNTGDFKRSVNKLPKIPLPIFDGETRSWPKFWNQFKRVHEDESLTDADKFTYLSKCMKPGTSAMELMETFPGGGEHYEDAVSYLQATFGNEALLVEIYVRDLLQLVISRAINKKHDFSLRSLMFKLETHIRSLEALGFKDSSKNAAFLYPLVEATLPETLLNEWGSSKDNPFNQTLLLPGSSPSPPAPDPDSYNNLELLMTFLKLKVQGESRVAESKKLASLESGTPISGKSDQRSAETPPATAAALVNPTKAVPAQVCCLCQQTTHNTQDCPSAAKMSYDDIQRTLSKQGVCFRCCQRGHRAKPCRFPVCCPRCAKAHYAILCRQIKADAEGSPPKEKQKKPSKQPTSKPVTTGLNPTFSCETLLKTVLVRVVGPKGTIVVRALCDDGSQKSYVDVKTARAVGLPVQRTETLRHSVFGGHELADITHAVYEVSIQSFDGNYSRDFVLLGQETICNSVDRLTDADCLERLNRRGVTLSDYGPGRPENIAILFGTNVLARIYTGQQIEIHDGLLAQETRFGWTLMGEIQEDVTRPSPTYLSLCTTSDPWSLDLIGIKDPFEKESVDTHNAKVLEKFECSITKTADQRYEVRLPWKEVRPILDSNLEMATKRLLSATKKLIREDRYAAYDAIFKEWEATGIIETVEDDREEHRPVHYLPHRGVVRESSESTKLRPVFDASCVDRHRRSLNSCLEQGPNLIELIPAILLRFRREPVGVAADISKAFLQISLHEDDRDMLRFLWWENADQRTTKIYRHRRVVFGVTSSPFMLAATLNHHFSVTSAYPDTVTKLRESFYVDDCCTSVPDLQAYETFRAQASAILNQGQFRLEKWKSNAYPPDSPNPVTSVLGLQWNLQRDELFCSTDSLRPDRKLTKRELASIAHSIFDPLGLVCPAVLWPQLLLQRAWVKNLDWDSELPADIQKEFKDWFKSVSYFHRCAIPRYYGAFIDAGASFHVFCDASKHAYAACIYLRMPQDTDVKLSLVHAKVRVAPTKKDRKTGVVTRATIPRLELLAAMIATRLYTTVQAALKVNIPVSFWSDSKVALCWITNFQDWSVFVQNRVDEIRKLSAPQDWHFVPGVMNPADLPSRGCTAKKLSETKWWEGPDWLKEPPASWPTPDFNFAECSDDINAELRKRAQAHVNIPMTITEPLLKTLDTRISRYTRIVRVRAWLYRYFSNLAAAAARRKQHTRLTSTSKPAGAPSDTPLAALKVAIANAPPLRPEELKRAELDIFRVIQRDLLTDSDRRKFFTYQDENGLTRIKSRVLTENSDAFRLPLLLPPCSIIEKFVQEQHLVHKHAGVLTMLTILRDNFWVVRARRLIKRLVSDCRGCKQFSARASQTPESPLPVQRTALGPAFQNTGVDLAGPLYLHDGSKVWIVLFTCAVYRAVHLELVQSLSTACFMLALRRFISRRGRVGCLMSDNGTNFTGTANLFQAIDRAQLDSAIVWKFNPPTAAWWGGFWERLVRSIKDLLKRNLGRASLNEVELYTLLCDCENIINSRPLTYVSEDPTDLAPLTPAHFLRDLTDGDPRDLDLVDTNQLQTRAHYLHQLRQDLRQRFRNEYLAMLVYRDSDKPTRPLQPGDIVLIESDTKKRLDWRLGRVVHTFPGKDGHHRMAELQTSSGNITRPFERLYALEIRAHEALALADPEQVSASRPHSPAPPDSNVEPVPPVSQVSNADPSLPDTQPDPVLVPPVVATRAGRAIRPPRRLNLLINSRFLSVGDFFVT